MKMEDGRKTKVKSLPEQLAEVTISHK